MTMVAAFKCVSGDIVTLEAGAQSILSMQVWAHECA